MTSRKPLITVLFLLATLLTLAGCWEEVPEETVYTPPQLSEERKALIESAWSQQDRFGSPGNAQFCELGDTEDGIRYYGSYTLGEGESALTCDIVYIPCPQLDVSAQITIGGYTFRSRNGFGLYAFSHASESFSPLIRSFQTEGGQQLIPDEVIATAAQLHTAYEQSLYGSELPWLPSQGDDPYKTALAQAKATWLLHRGEIPAFGQNLSGLRYYGRFEGFDIIFQKTNLGVVSTQEIAGHTFTCSSSFVLYASRNGELRDLRLVYNDGLISDDAIAQIAAFHNDPSVLMQGMLVSHTGAVQKYFDLSVSSQLTQGSEGSEEKLELTFTLPDGFPYLVKQLSSISTEPLGGLPYHVLMGYGYKGAPNSPIFAQCAYSMEDSLLIIDWDDGSGTYLVASAAPDTTPQEIIDYFQDFLELFCKSE